MLQPPRSSIWLTMLAITARATSAAGQGLSPSDAPIDLRLTPAIAAPGDSVTIAGSTMVGKQREIKIAVTPPQGLPLAITAQASAEGAFAVKFGATSGTGTYRVTATAIDGKGTATDSFAIVTLSGMVDRQAAALSDAYQALTEANTALTTIVRATPPSPPQQQALEQFQQLADQLKEAPSRVDTYRRAMGEIAKAGEEQPIVRPPLRQVFDSLNRGVDSIRRHTNTVREQVAASKKGSDLCDDLALAQAGLDAMAYAFSLTKGVTKLAIDFAVSYGAKKAADYVFATNAPAAVKSAATFSIKTHFSIAEKLFKGKPVDDKFWTEKSASIANSLVKIVGAGVFDAYCQKFEGPVTALFHVDFLNDGTPYVKYDIALQGRMAVHYRKTTQPGAPVALVGYIEGNGTNFRLWENAIVLDEKGVCRTHMICLHRAFVPEGSPFYESIGLIARQATPAYFLVRVGGQIADGKMTLEVLDARQDFSDLVRGRIMYIGLGATLIPGVFKSDVPFQKARFILAKGMREKPEFPITVDQKAQVSRVERTFTREERRGGADGVIVQWKIDAKACNPKCP
jgi:hypothetical protein